MPAILVGWMVDVGGGGEERQSVAHTLRHGDIESKKRLASVIDQLYKLGGELPPRINDNRRRLASQIVRAE